MSPDHPHARTHTPALSHTHARTVQVWEPVPVKSAAANTEYLCTLYTRCINSKKASNDALAAKWLKPLGSSSRPSTAR
jgi:hypothetical protein